MKKILLLAVAALMVTSASAQLQRSASKKAHYAKSEMTVKPQALMKEMHMADAANPIVRAPKKASYIDGYYKIRLMEN